jgi:hypothetical protein
MTNEPTQEQREEVRKVALRSLGETPLMDLAAVYLIEQNGQYGEAGSSAVEQFKYLPALQSSKGSKLILGNLLGSRQSNKRYTGNVSEYNIIHNCAKIMNESLGAVTVQDILTLTGSNQTVSEKYKDSYISDLAQSENEEDKEIFKQVMGVYMQHFTDTKVAEALLTRAGANSKGLEGLVCEPEKEELADAA